MKKASIIGYEVSLGANKRGSELTPGRIINATLFKEMKAVGVSNFDVGKVSITGDMEKDSGQYAKNLYPILEACESLSEKVSEAIKAGSFPIVIGGDHTSSMGAIAGLSDATKKKCGVIYFDAHGDFNTPKTTPSGNVHGMTLALATGQFKEMYKKAPELDHPFADPSKVVIIGARSLDREEAIALKKSGVHVFTMEDLDQWGIKDITEKAIAIACKDDSPLHLSIDIDVLDPAFAPGVNTPSIGGLSYRELTIAIEMIRKAKNLGSADIAEANLELDKNGLTEEIVIGLILNLLGKNPSASLL